MGDRPKRREYLPKNRVKSINSSVCQVFGGFVEVLYTNRGIAPISCGFVLEAGKVLPAVAQSHSTHTPKRAAASSWKRSSNIPGAGGPIPNLLEKYELFGIQCLEEGLSHSPHRRDHRACGNHGPGVLARCEHARCIRSRSLLLFRDRDRRQRHRAGRKRQRPPRGELRPRSDQRPGPGPDRRSYGRRRRQGCQEGRQGEGRQDRQGPLRCKEPQGHPVRLRRQHPLRF